MGWCTPPNRRELTLLLFALTIFTLSYNLDNSIRLLGLDPIAKQGAVFSKLGLGGPSIIGKDGRRPSEWRDTLERIIFGDWAWDQGHLAGDGAERTQRIDTGKYDAMWLDKKGITPLGGTYFGDYVASDVMVQWQEDSIPETKLIKHAPGYTILDSVFLHKGSVYVVTDARDQFPSVHSIVSSDRQWKIISTGEAKDAFGRHGGKIHGVTWISTDPQGRKRMLPKSIAFALIGRAAAHITLLSLWRTYSSLDPSINSTGWTTLPPPQRIFFPNILQFSDPNPPFEDYSTPRIRSNTGFHPLLRKAVFPTMGVMYREDWNDYHSMEIPYIMERVVVADRSSALLQSNHDGQPVFAPSFDLDGSAYWWEPIRRSLAVRFEMDRSLQTAGSGKPGITYLYTRRDLVGPRLRDEDHEALVKALEVLRHENYNVFIISSHDEDTPWNERMKAISRSTILLSVHGNHLLDGAFLSPSSRTTLMEIFPLDTFVRDRELVARSLRINYVAWWNDLQLNSENLPAVSQPHNQQVVVDANAVVRSIRQIFEGPG